MPLISAESYSNEWDAVRQAREVREILTEGGQLDDYFPGLTDRYSTFWKALRSVRRAAQNPEVNADILRINDAPIGVATRIREGIITSKGEIVASKESINTAYWLARKEDLGLRYGDFHLSAGRYVVHAALEQDPESLVWALLDENIDDDPSRGISRQLHKIGEPNEFRSLSDNQAIMSPRAKQLYINSVKLLDY